LPSLVLTVVLQVTTTTVATPLVSAPIWVTMAELAFALGLIAVVGTVLTRLVRDVVLRAGATKSVATSITQWMGVLMLIAAAGVVTTVAGLSSYLTALTLSGIAGLAVSLALQNTITNVISGVLMQRDGIVRIGDDVQYGLGGVRGEVVKLSLRTTWLKTKDGVIVVIGNSNLAAGPILNYTSLARLEKKLEA
jgi:small conductance mechanosensitive channel